MIRYFFMLLTLIVLGCAPYKTFYKDTVIAKADVPHKKIYRLHINGNETIDTTDINTLNKLASLKFSNTSPKKVGRILNLLPNPEKLKVIILDSLNLETLPFAIARFTNLTQISLNHNPKLNLDHIFKIIKDSPIEFLNLQDNQLSELPKSILLLKNLKDLNLSNNTITKSQTFETLAVLPQLYSLWLTNNHLKSLPKSIGKLSQLKNLYIEHNQLITIPPEVMGLKKVWVVHAGHNLFKELPVAFSTMPSLFLLHINNCIIKSIPEIYAIKSSGPQGLILDNNLLSISDKKKWMKKKSRFFILSMND